MTYEWLTLSQIASLLKTDRRGACAFVQRHAGANKSLQWKTTNCRVPMFRADQVREIANIPKPQQREESNLFS
jgi:hypothetical protein